MSMREDTVTRTETAASDATDNVAEESETITTDVEGIPAGVATDVAAKRCVFQRAHAAGHKVLYCLTELKVCAALQLLIALISVLPNAKRTSNVKMKTIATMTARSSISELLLENCQSFHVIVDLIMRKRLT